MLTSRHARAIVIKMGFAWPHDLRGLATPKPGIVSRNQLQTPALLGAIGGDLSTVLPIHTPGGFGTYEAGVMALASPLASPGRAKSLAGLPPALVLSAECDPLRDEGEDYGRALQAAGVPTQVQRLSGLVHGVYNMSAFVPRVAEFNTAIAGFLKPLLQRARAEA